MVAGPQAEDKEPDRAQVVMVTTKEEKLAKVRYTHEAMIDLVIANPWISQNEIAKHFGYSVPWVSVVFCSDAFQERLAQRKDELVDPQIRATLDERFKGLVYQSMELLKEKLNRPAHQVPDELVLQTLEIASKAAGYGARNAAPVVNNNFAVVLPQKAESSAAWERRYERPVPEVKELKVLGDGLG